MSDWQPIETAPLDGSEFLAATRGCFGVRLMRWDDQRYHRRPVPYFAEAGWNRVAWDRANQPTHWMPLPEPPK